MIRVIITHSERDHFDSSKLKLLVVRASVI